MQVKRTKRENYLYSPNFTEQYILGYVGSKDNISFSPQMTILDNPKIRFKNKSLRSAQKMIWLRVFGS
jgi:hypothetical protein